MLETVYLKAYSKDYTLKSIYLKLTNLKANHVLKVYT